MDLLLEKEVKYLNPSKKVNDLKECILDFG